MRCLLLPDDRAQLALHIAARRSQRLRRAPDDEPVLPELETFTRSELLASGLTRRGLITALERGEIIRARRDRYLSPLAAPSVRAAVRVGGRLTCLSLLELLGIFVFENTGLHVHVMRGASRLRSPSSRLGPIPPRRVRRFRVHWMPLVRPDEGTSACVGVVDALIHAVLCQSARHAVATLDSALNRGVIDTLELSEIFAALPSKHRVLLPLIDGRAESGSETLMRLIARALGCSVVPQVRFDGVGRVDLLIDGWLVVECDSRGFHADWKQQVTDRERDLALARLGYATLRVTAAQIFHEPDKVARSLRGLIEAHRRRGERD